MPESFDGFEWRPLRAALILGRIANNEFEKRKLTRGLTGLAGKSPGALMALEAKDEVNFREALELIGFNDVDIETAVQEVLEHSKSEQKDSKAEVCPF
jgi:hypothetical protein